MTTKLEPEEQDILESFEKDEWRSVPNLASEMKRYQESAEAALKREKQISIHISEADFAAFQKKASAEGVPYETLMSHVLRKYISGRLIEKDA